MVLAMVLRACRLALAFCVLVAVFAAGIALDAETTLGLLPALLIAAPLLAGRYVGERGIARLRAARPRGRRLPVAVVAPALAPREDGAGGLLLARRLAGRAPPRSVRIAT
jgi:hypothetical protein